MKNKKSIIIFWLLIAVFLTIIIGTYIIKWLRGPYFIPAITIFFLLGIALIFFTLKEKVKGKLKKFLLLTGASATGFFVSVLLHNFLYALNIIFNHITILKYLTEILHIAFFFIAIIVCPMGFLIGIIGSLYYLNKK